MNKAEQMSAIENNDDQYNSFVDQRRVVAAESGESLLSLTKENKRGREWDFEIGQKNVERYKAEIKKLREEIDFKKSSLISRIVDFREIRNLRKALERNEVRLGKSEDEQAQRNLLLEYFNRIIADEEKLGEFMDEAFAENAEFDERKRQELVMEEQGRDVGNLIKKHKVFFVHDIVDADWKPSANNRTIDTKQLSFENQLDIILGLDPTLSVSTLSPDSKNRTFGRGSWGVLFSGGRVLGGEQADAGTVSYGLRDRHITKDNRSVASIDKAIERPDGGGKMDDRSYNELVLEKPEAAGIYFKLSDNYPALAEGVSIPLGGKFNGVWLSDEWWDMLQSSMDSGAPIFVIDTQNNVRMVYDINIKARTIKVTPKYDPENLVNMPGIYKMHTTASHKRAAITRSIDKVGHLIPGEELSDYQQNKSEHDGKMFYNIH